MASEPTRKKGNAVFSGEVQEALMRRAKEAQDRLGHTDNDTMPIPTSEQLVRFLNTIPSEQVDCFMYLTMRFSDIGYDEAMKDFSEIMALAKTQLAEA